MTRNSQNPFLVARRALERVIPPTEIEQRPVAQSHSSLSEPLCSSKAIRKLLGVYVIMQIVLHTCFLHLSCRVGEFVLFPTPKLRKALRRSSDSSEEMFYTSKFYLLYYTASVQSWVKKTSAVVLLFWKSLLSRLCHGSLSLTAKSRDNS